MGTGDIIAIGAICLIIGFAVFYVIRAKKNGQNCIGCPSAKTCGGSCGSCSCGCGENK